MGKSRHKIAISVRTEGLNSALNALNGKPMYGPGTRGLKRVVNSKTKLRKPKALRGRI